MERCTKGNCPKVLCVDHGVPKLRRLSRQFPACSLLSHRHVPFHMNAAAGKTERGPAANVIRERRRRARDTPPAWSASAVPAADHHSAIRRRSVLTPCRRAVSWRELQCDCAALGPAMVRSPARRVPTASPDRTVRSGQPADANR